MVHPLGYSGPSDNFIPIEGAGTQLADIESPGYNPAPTYADINYLNTELATLVTQCTDLITAMQSVLQGLSLVVTTDPSDVGLQNANEVLWPSALGQAPNYITYLYYQSLANINSAAATFIRNAYETAARGITGSNAIDLLPLTQMTLDEANLIQDFADTYAGQLSDSSQRRTVELLQDWVESALKQIINIQNQFNNSTANQLDSNDVGALSTTDASNTQAILQVNLNQMNAALAQSLGVLQQYFVQYQTTFYNNVLGPAMGFRNSVITSMYPILPGTVGAVVNTSTDIINSNLQTVLADQQRRNIVYETQVQNTLTSVAARDAYKNYIIQLSDSGQIIPTGTSGTMISSSDTPDQAAFFQSTVAPDATPSNPYMAPHSQLSGLSDPLAHAQYLLKSGDTMEGDLDLDTAVLVDGMRPGTHTHTGNDGTLQVHGADILQGSVPTTAVNTTELPIVPTNIVLVNQNTDTISGAVTVDIALQWTGDSQLTYEVQIAKATSN